MLNTIFKVEHNSHIEVEGTGENSIRSLRQQLKSEGMRFPHIVLVAFKNPKSGELVYPVIKLSKRQKK